MDVSVLHTVQKPEKSIYRLCKQKYNEPPFSNIIRTDTTLNDLIVRILCRSFYPTHMILLYISLNLFFHIHIRVWNETSQVQSISLLNFKNI